MDAHEYTLAWMMLGLALLYVPLSLGSVYWSVVVIVTVVFVPFYYLAAVPLSTIAENQ